MPAEASSSVVTWNLAGSQQKADLNAVKVMLIDLVPIGPMLQFVNAYVFSENCPQIRRGNNPQPTLWRRDRRCQARTNFLAPAIVAVVNAVHGVVPTGDPD